MENSDKKPQPKPAPHPVLEKAAAEIDAILKKHDIAGVVQLFTPGFNKYTMNLQPSWSVIAIDKTGLMRLTPPLVDPENPKAAETKILDTVRMLANLRIYLGKIVLNITQAEITVRQTFKIETVAGPGNPQEN